MRLSLYFCSFLGTDSRAEFQIKVQHILTVTSVKHNWSCKIFTDSFGDYDVNSRQKSDSCIKLHISQRSCNQVCISLDVLRISCLAILRIFALGVIPVSRTVGVPSSFPSSSLIVVGIPASRSRSVEFELSRALFTKFPNIYFSQDHWNSLAVFLIH